MRRCECCNVLKPLTNFLEREDRKGHYVWCKTCVNVLGRSVTLPGVVGGLADGGLSYLQTKKFDSLS